MTETGKVVSKVPAVTLVFWLVKIACTTLGETGGDAVTMSMKLGYLTGTLIFAAVFVVAVALQIVAKRFNPWLYWLTIIATTTVGTTIADYVDRSLGIGYAGGSLILVAGLAASLIVWRLVTGSVDVASVTSARSEAFYWVTIMFSQTLGTALGDWTADSAGMGYTGAALLFGGLLAVIALLHVFTKTPKTWLFWAAFVLTRPLGAVVGDFLDKPLDHGGLNLDRFAASGVLVAIVVALIVFVPQRAGRHPGEGVNGSE